MANWDCRNAILIGTVIAVTFFAYDPFDLMYVLRNVVKYFSLVGIELRSLIRFTDFNIISGWLDISIDVRYVAGTKLIIGFIFNISKLK